jgi:hypothetical protein
MRYKVDNKNVNIPDQVIDLGMKEGLTRQEAVDRYLSDEGIAVDPTVIALTEKAKAAGTGAKNTADKPKRKPPERKPDEIKRALIDILAIYLGTTADIENLEVTNVERMIAFEVKGEKFEITLTKKRKPKE